MNSIRKLERLDQFLPSYARWDAIGTHARELQTLIRAAGLQSDVFYEIPNPATVNDSHHVSQYRWFNEPQAAIINHFSTGSVLNYLVGSCRNFVTTCYHNITPASYFAQAGDGDGAKSCQLGMMQVPVVARRTSLLWSPSLFNLEHFQPYYSGPTAILPILRRFDQPSTSGPQNSASRASGKKMLLFVGRVIAHKGVHDLMFLTHLLKARSPNEYQLMVVGDCGSVYARKTLPKVGAALGLRVAHGMENSKETLSADVIMAGQVSDQQLAEAYQQAWAFVTMSDHEGYCVPVVEALSFGLPVIANRAAAIPETLGSAGVIVSKEDWSGTLTAIQALAKDEASLNVMRNRSRQEFANRFQFDAGVRAHQEAIAGVLRAHSTADFQQRS